MWSLAEKMLKSRLILGTARFPSPEVLKQSILASGTDLVTLSLRRQSSKINESIGFWEIIRSCNVELLPNTAGCRSAREAITTAHLARELFGTHWIKLEVIGDEQTLQPDPFGLVEAAVALIAEGFEVFPYMTEDLVLADRLVNAGCKILMPWGSPIGSGRGLNNLWQLKILRQRFTQITLIVDAGIGAPSHASHAMELGYDGVLVNTAIATAIDPVKMAQAFASAVDAGRAGYEAGLMHPQESAVPSTPVLGTPFRQETK